MIEHIRNKYLNSLTQIVVLNQSGQVIQTDNQLFAFPLQSLLEDFHPFFYIIASLLEEENQETVFSGVHIEYLETKMVLDVIVNSGSETSNPFVILIDFSSYYKNFQSIAQEKNESILSFHLEELKNQQLEAEKLFKDKFLANATLGNYFFCQQIRANSVDNDSKGLRSNHQRIKRAYLSFGARFT